MLSYLERWKTPKYQSILFALVIVVVFILIFALNFLTPLVADDFDYSYNWATGELVSNVGDVIESQYNHYLTWGGRTVAHTMAQLFLWWGKPVFTVANTIAYILLSLVLFRHATAGLTVKYPVIVYLFVNLLIWFFAPVFGQTILWTTGACNYLWTGLIILSYLLPYRHLIYGKTFKNIVLVPIMLLLGIVAGWCNENTSGMAILLAITFTAWHYVQRKRIPAWTICGLVGALIGFTMLLASPGNVTRGDIYSSQGFFTAVAVRLFRCFRTFAGDMQPLFILAVISITVLLFSKATMLSKGLSSIYFFGALACNFAMMLSPAYPIRAQFGTFIPLALSALTAVAGIWEIPCEKQELQWIKRVAGTSTMVIVAFLFAASYTVELANAGDIWLVNNERESYILQERENDNLNITVKTIRSDSSYSPFHEIADVPSARYYGVDSITVLPVEAEKNRKY